ncbi:hypothetical protein [Phenylobacterium ferrooxidans]|uniref:Uncharacterized protein n=1 Tax=Phenylobacterium ferrooxidans TaxID=2982689 RepID=A0ABW6CN58_9CAUL
MEFFACAALRATMSVKGCGTRWTQAQGGDRIQEAARTAVRSTYGRAKSNISHRAVGAMRRDLVNENESFAQSERVAGAMEARASLTNTCRSCPIGAAHAGADHVHHSKLFGASICPACRTGATRMIGNKVCVSCYNRRRELRAGKNARGNAPIELMQRPVHPIEFRMAVDGRPRRVRAQGADLLEPMVQALRVTKGELAFAFVGPERTLQQARLF